MAQQQLKVIPKELFLQFEGVSPLVRPDVEYTGGEAREIPVLAGRDGFEQLYTDSIIPIFNILFPVYLKSREGQEDAYHPLAEKQPLVRANKLPQDVAADVLNEFGDKIFRQYAIWAELGPDWQPEKRTKGYKLPKGMNAVLYRNWDLFEDGIDVSKATTIPIKWMEKDGDVSKEIIEQLGVPQNTYVWADKKYAINNYDRLNALCWDFRVRGWPYLFSFRGPRGRGSFRGAVVGRRLSAEEMVKNFDPSKVRVEPKAKISQYQVELQELKRNLDELKDFYSNKIKSMEKSIANLKKIKPE